MTTVCYDYLIRRLSNGEIAFIAEQMRYCIHIAWCANIYPKWTMGYGREYTFVILRGKNNVLAYKKIMNEEKFIKFKEAFERYGFTIFLDEESNLKTNALIMVDPKVPVWNYTRSKPIFTHFSDGSESEYTIPEMNIVHGKHEQIIYKWMFEYKNNLLQKIWGTFVNSIEDTPIDYWENNNGSFKKDFREPTPNKDTSWGEVRNDYYSEVGESYIYKKAIN